MIRQQLNCRTARQHGFTIIELLIATMIFSVVLLIITGGILQITRVYYKGVTEANTQNAARSIIDTISQAIQFNGGVVQATPAPTVGAAQSFCVGSLQFSYRLGYQLVDGATGTNQTNNSLREDTISGCTAMSAGATFTGRELMSPKMRLSSLSVQPAGTNLWKITVQVTYGDDDLLNNPTAANASCKGIQAGTQFCSVSELSTIVVKRI